MNPRLLAVPTTAALLGMGPLGCMRPSTPIPCHCPSGSTIEAPSVTHPPSADARPLRSHDQQALARHFAQARPLQVLRGKATYYGDSLAGNKTASGEVYNPRAFTAAHKTLPFGTTVRVVRTDTEPHRIVYVRITDRGPFGERRRIIDVSRAAAEELDMIRAGVVEVRVEVIAPPVPARSDS